MDWENKTLVLAAKNPEKFIDDLMLEIEPNHLQGQYSTKMYQWLEKRYINNDHIGLGTMIADLNLPEQAIDFDLILESDFESYMQKIKDNFAQRQVKEAANKLNDIASDNMKAEEYRKKAQEIIFEIDSDNADKKIIELDDALAEAYENLVKKDEDEIGQGLQTGFPSLDNQIGGLEPGHITVLAGQTSMGKTAFALNISHNVIRQDKRVLFFSLEMKAKEIADRLIIRDAKVDASKYQKKLDDVGWKNINAALDRLTGKPLLISEKRGLGVSEIRAKAMKVARQKDIDMMVVDYLQMINPPKSNENMARKIGDIVRRLRTLAGDINVPILLLSQMNRQVDGKPTMNKLRDSGMIEEIADEVWLLWRPEYDKEKEKQEVKQRQEAELIMGKGRTKGTGYVPFKWYPKLQTFRDDYIEQTEGKLNFNRGG